MKIRSQSRRCAGLMIARREDLWTTWAAPTGTSATSAASSTVPGYFSARASQSFRYCSGVSVTVRGSIETAGKVGETVSAVTFALIDFAKRRTAAHRAFPSISASSRRWSHPSWGTDATGAPIMGQPARPTSRRSR